MANMFYQAASNVALAFTTRKQGCRAAPMALAAFTLRKSAGPTIFFSSYDPPR